METLKVVVHVRRSSAIRAGRSRFGLMLVDVSEGMLAAMSPDEREVLAGLSSSLSSNAGAVLDLGDASEAAPETISAALAVEAAKLAVERAEKASEIAMRLCRILAARTKLCEVLNGVPATERDFGYTRGIAYRPAWPSTEALGLRYGDLDGRYYVDELADQHPNIKSLVAAWRAHADEMSRAAERNRVAELAEQERVKAEKEAQRIKDEEEAEAAIRAYACRIDQLSRAASENYDVVHAVLDYIAQRIAAPFEGSTIIKVDSEEWDASNWEERPAPRPAAFAAFDKVKAHAASIEVPRGVTVTVGRIQRFREHDEAPWRTVVIVHVDTSFWKDRKVVIPAE